MPEEEVRAVANGMIYSGTQAQALGLVDEIAYTDDALKAMKTAYGLEDAGYSTILRHLACFPIFLGCSLKRAPT